MKWEYLIIKRIQSLDWSESAQENIMRWFWLNHPFDKTVSEQDGLNQLGQEHWELMRVSENPDNSSKEYLFKRPIL